jgi:AAA+ ATPase superfamily predicted ATPase
VTLTLKAFEASLSLFLYCGKNEILLCQEFIEEINRGLKIDVLGEFNNFARLFEYLLVHSQTKSFTLVIDEFQEFLNVSSGVYGEMQKLWDRYKATAKMNLILCGSVFSMMKKIFENEKEPLFGRANERVSLQPFSVDVLKTFSKAVSPTLKIKISLHSIRLPEVLPDMLSSSVTRNLHISTNAGQVFRENSLLIDEGKNVLIGRVR